MNFYPHCCNELCQETLDFCRKVAEQKPTKGKKVKRYLVPVAVFMAAFLVMLGACSPATPEIDLEDYIIIEGAEGFNGSGEIVYSLDESAFYADMIGEENFDEMNEENFSEMFGEAFQKYEEVEYALDCIVLMASPESDLSNGDTVTITAAFQDDGAYEFHHRFKDGSKTYAVEGLIEGKTFDPFAEDCVAVSFEGFSGTATASADVLTDNEAYTCLRYALSKSTGLSNGDTVTLTVSYDADDLESLGYFAPEQTETTYTVSGLSEYFDLDDGFPENQLAELRSAALGLAKDTVEGNLRNKIMVLAPEIVGTYFLKVQDPSQPYQDYFHGLTMDNGVVVMIHAITNSNDVLNKDFNDWYFYLYPNFYRDSSGHMIYDGASFEEYVISADSQEEAAAWMAENFEGMTITSLE